MSPQAGNSYDPETEQPNETIEVPSGHDTEVFAQTIRDIEQPTAAPKPGEFQRDVVDEVTTEQPKREAWEKAWEKFLNARFPGRDLPNWCGPDATTRENFIYAYFEGVATQQEELERMKWELAAEVERFAEMVRQCESETKHESLAMVKPFCDSVVSRATLLSALCDLADELVAVKAELAAVREGVGAFMDERMEVLRRTYGHDSSKVAGARWMAECVKDHFDALLK